MSNIYICMEMAWLQIAITLKWNFRGSPSHRRPIQPNFLRSFNQNYYNVLFAIERATEAKILLHTSFSEIFRTFPTKHYDFVLQNTYYKHCRKNIINENVCKAVNCAAPLVSNVGSVAHLATVAPHSEWTRPTAECVHHIYFTPWPDPRSRSRSRGFWTSDN